MQKRRHIGQYITEANALPTFSAEAQHQLKMAVPEQMHHILADIRQHIKLETGGLVISRGEYQILGQKLISVYPSLADADNKKSSVSEPFLKYNWNT